MSRKIRKIRTGGQSGVDRAALDVARELNIEICGWCPRGGWAEDYTTPPGLLSDYPELTETPSAGTTQRTLWNMRDADAILTIIPRDGRGTFAEAHVHCKWNGRCRGGDPLAGQSAG